MDRVSSSPHRPHRLSLDRQLWDKMRKDVQHRFPEEACGLIAGVEDRGREVIPITNQLHSRTLYRFEPHEQIEAFNYIQNKGWELTAIYHSHPQGPQTPSAKDIAEAYYPESVYLIWTKTNQGWICRGFSIQEGEVIEIPLIINPEE